MTSEQRLVLGQEAVAGKSNEITAIPLLLERLELAGALVTLDAIGCQTKIARTIFARGADYLLAVKTNWPALHAEIERYFAETPAAALDRLTTPMAIMAGSRPVITPSVAMSLGWPTAATPASPAFPASRPS